MQILKAFFMFSLLVPRTHADDQVGSWGNLIDWNIIGIHSVLTPQGKVLTFGTDDRGVQGASFIYDVWDPRLGTGAESHEILPMTTNTDIFCAAQIVLPSTGQVLLPGGDTVGGANIAIRDTAIFDGQSNEMKDAGFSLSFPRWYPTATTLPNGEILLQGGSDVGVAGNGILTPEIYNSKSGWRSLLGAYSEYAYGNDFKRWWYPRSWVTPNGRVFGLSGPAMYFLDYQGDGSITPVGEFSGANKGATSTAVMYRPGLILQVGGGHYQNGGGAAGSKSASIIDVRGNQAIVTETTPMSFARHWANSTILPNGEVLVTGGSEGNVNLDGAGAAFWGEIWNPDTGNWSTVSREDHARLYHSTALLLPDGRILSVGGGAPGPVDNLDAQIYSPPYLFSGNNLATRPQYQLDSHSVDYAGTLSLDVESEFPIDRVTLVKTGAVTHSFNQDQRFIELDFTERAGILSISLPDSPNIATPGFYMLFILDDRGVPSVAEQIHFNVPVPTRDIEPIFNSGIDSFDLDGVDDYISFDHKDNLNLDDQITLSSWIYVNDFGDWNGILTKGQDSASWSLQLGAEQALRFSANIGSSNGIGTGFWDSDSKLTANKWHHVAVTYDGRNIRFYIDGQLDTNQPAVDLLFSDNTEPVILGADLPYGDEFFHGSIREAKVYNQVLSPSEVLDLSREGFAIVEDLSIPLTFNGVDDFYQLDHESSLNIQDEITIAARIFVNEFGDWDGIVSKGQNSAPWAMQLWGDGSLRFTANWGAIDGVGEGSWNSSRKLSANTWHHVAVSYGPQGIRFYIDGLLDENQPDVDLSFGENEEPLFIGADFPGGDEYFDGLIQDVKVFNRVVQSEDILTLAEQRAVLKTLENPRSFDGVDDFVSVPHNELYNFPNHQLSLTARIFVNEFGDWDGIITKGETNSPWSMQVWGDGSLRFSSNWGTAIGGGNWNSTAKLSLNTWHDVAITYDGTHIRFYIDGVLDENQPKVNLFFGRNEEPLFIGADLPGGDEFFDGMIQDVAIYPRALSLHELPGDQASISDLITEALPEARAFNGVSDFFQIAHSEKMEVNNSITVAANIFVNEFGDWDGLVTKGESTSPWAMQLWGDGSLRFTANWGLPEQGGSWNSTTKLTTGQWHHVAITYDGATIKFYIDGVLDSHQPGINLEFGENTQPLFVGADFPGGDEYFDGSIRNVKVYSNALSAARISELSGEKKAFFEALEAERTFNGTNDFYEAAHDQSQVLSDSISISASIFVDEFGDWDGVVTKGLTNSPWAMQLWGDGSLRFTANWGFAGEGGSWNSASKLTAGQWNHVVITYNGSRIRFYINGELDSYQPEVELTFAQNQEPLFIGADFPGGDEYFDGAIRNVKIFAEALSAAEVSQLD